MPSIFNQYFWTLLKQTWPDFWNFMWLCTSVGNRPRNPTSDCCLWLQQSLDKCKNGYLHDLFCLWILKHNMYGMVFLSVTCLSHLRFMIIWNSQVSILLVKMFEITIFNKFWLLLPLFNSLLISLVDSAESVGGVPW